MDFNAILNIIARWLHVVSAVLAVGGAFFLRVILPIGTASLEPEQREAVLLRCRRGLKMIVHPAILFLLLTGVYNTIRNWAWYKAYPPVMHAFFGLHVLLAVVVISISLWLLAGREPRRGHRRWMKLNIALMLLTILVASGLKWARDRVMAKQAGTPVRLQQW